LRGDILIGRERGHYGGDLGVGDRAHVLDRRDLARRGQELIEETPPPCRIRRAGCAVSSGFGPIQNPLDAVAHAISGDGFCVPEHAPADELIE